MNTAAAYNNYRAPVIIYTKTVFKKNFYNKYNNFRYKTIIKLYFYYTN